MPYGHCSSGPAWAPPLSANWQIDVYGYWPGPGLIGGVEGWERAWLCPDRPIHTASPHMCRALPGMGSLHRDIEHGTHPPQHLSPQQPSVGSLPSPAHNSLLILGSFVAPFPSSFTLLSNWVQIFISNLRRLSILDPTIGSKHSGLSLLPLLFLTAPKKSFNIHFSLLFQTVLKINFKIFLDPVI